MVSDLEFRSRFGLCRRSLSLVRAYDKSVGSNYLDFFIRHSVYLRNIFSVR